MKSRSLRIALFIILFLIVLLALVAVFLPSILSTGQARRLVLRKVNSAAPGELSVESWLLTWSGGIRLSGIGYTDETGSASVHVDEIRLDQGLLALVRDYRHFGTIEVQRPVVRVTALSPVPDADVDVPAAAGPPVAGSATPEEQTSAPVLPDLHGHVRVRDGSMLVTTATGEEETVLQAVDIDLDLEGLAQPVHYRVDARSADAEGTLASEGDVTLARDGMFAADRIAVDSGITIQSLDLDPLTRFAAALGGVPIATGILNSRFSVAGSLGEGLHVAGNVFVPDLRLAGGPLGTDAPELGQVVVVVDATYLDSLLQISNLTVRSSVLNAYVEGRVEDASAATVTAAATLDLGTLSSQFPEALSIREGLVVSDGTLAVTSDVARVDESIEFDVSAVLRDLEGSLDGQSVSWDEPTALAARGMWAPDDWRLDTLRLHSPFLRVSGEGTPRRAHVTVNAELDAAQNELGKFVSLDEWQAGGDATLDIRIDEAGDQSRVVQSSLAVSGATLVRAGATLVPPSDIRVDTAGRVELDGATPSPGLMRPSLSWETWMGSGRVSGESLRFGTADDGTGTMPEVLGLTLQGGIDLAALARLLQALEAMPPEQTIGGRAEFDATGEVRADVVTIQSAKLAVSPFEVSMPQGSLEDEVSLDLSGRVGLADRQLWIPSATLQSTAGTVGLRNVRAGEDEAGPQLHAEGQGALDLRRLLAVIGDMVEIPEGTSVAGKASTSFEVRVAPGAQNEIRLQAELEPLQIASEGRPVVSEERVRFSAHASQTAGGEPIRVHEFDLESTPLTVRGRGSWTAGTEQNAAQADGTFAVDLDVLAAYLRALAGVDLEMRGKDEQPFTFSAAWAPGSSGEIMRGASFETAFRADEIRGFGLSVQELHVPLAIRDGMARAELSARVNQGTVQVTPVVDLTAEPRRLTLENPTNLLNHVELTDDMADQLLGRIHPMFRGASVVGGRVHLGMDHFEWPLDEAYRSEARFAGRLELMDLRMRTTGMLNRLLEAMKVREREMDIGDRTIDFTCVNERIECSPTKIEVEDTILTISGTMGLDQTLDYVAELPVTRALVGNEAYPYLEGTTIRVPIRGTASSPDLSTRMVQDAAADLARQALQKAVRDKGTELLEGLLSR